MNNKLKGSATVNFSNFVLAFSKIKVWRVSSNYKLCQQWYFQQCWSFFSGT